MARPPWASSALVHPGKHQSSAPFNKFYGINCRPELGAKLLDRVLIGGGRFPHQSMT